VKGSLSSTQLAAATSVRLAPASFHWSITQIDEAQVKIQILEVEKAGDEKVAMEIQGKKLK
jgi:hypothetical protein